MKRHRNSVTVSVDVDIDELVEELTDEEIIDLAERVGHSGPRGEVQRAIIMLRQGRVDDGIALLEREFFSDMEEQGRLRDSISVGHGESSMRFNGHRYVDCRWCAGRGCLSCEAEFDKDYKREFPDGPKPIATFKLDTSEGLERARRAFGAEALQKAFGSGGGGIAEFMANLAKEGGQ